RSPRPWRDGIHVVRIDDVLLVKRLESAGPGRVRVLSDNPAYPRFERPLAEVAIIGRVVWKGGRI
ncbi:S24 family peptidase, partial [Enterococcus faecalis]|uniref:S24 family peptidase n=1 Tax=Enterococcus faecalis TaxID=1351 RepID=UPI00403F5CA5